MITNKSWSWQSTEDQTKLISPTTDTHTWIPIVSKRPTLESVGQTMRRRCCWTSDWPVVGDGKTGAATIQSDPTTHSQGPLFLLFSQTKSSISITKGNKWPCYWNSGVLFCFLWIDQDQHLPWITTDGQLLGRNFLVLHSFPLVFINQLIVFFFPISIVNLLFFPPLIIHFLTPSVAWIINHDILLFFHLDLNTILNKHSTVFLAVLPASFKCEFESM